MTAVEHKPWYRQFWPWFLIALPATVVVAGITTVVIAVRSSDSVVSDHYYREGLAINRVMARDRRAGELQLEALMTLGSRQIEIQLRGLLKPLPPTVVASFKHPLQADKDFSVPLSHLGGRDYRGELPGVVNGRWYLHLQDLAGEWQLQSEVQLPGTGPIRLVAGAPDA